YISSYHVYTTISEFIYRTSLLYDHLMLFLLTFHFTDTASTGIYTLPLHDALPICRRGVLRRVRVDVQRGQQPAGEAGRLLTSLRSEEHTSELQSRFDLVCRLLLEKKN